MGLLATGWSKVLVRVGTTATACSKIVVLVGTTKTVTVITLATRASLATCNMQKGITFK
jgi:hypothetical protein